ncbi:MULTISPECIES: FtsQ-type POTRA domain-containing protein [unclassified Microbacterium]|uniref:FtsQ-type POTRA domain-containing protein n=1 Tax=unclassified Microbacterium TaxID=2609290 RepID=UPI0030197505
MRRPVPLPTERPAPSARPDVPADLDATGPDLLPAPRPRRSSPSTADDPGQDDAAPTASAAPSVTRAPGAPGAPAGVDGAGEDSVDGIRVREVWSAARARRKALRAEVRRFTVRQRRRRMLWIGVLGALVVLVLGSIGAAYSPLFAVERVRVVGTQTLDPAAVEAALSGQVGVPLPRVDASAVKAALVAFPLVESYTLEARPPHELVVRIVERTPIGSLESAAGYTLVDAAGVALSTTPQPPPGHPVLTVEGGVGSPAFDAIGTVFRSLPDDIRAQVTAMSATTANDVTLTLGGTGTQVVWGNADDSELKSVVLAKAMTALPPSGVSSYDVSSPGTVVTR